MDSTAVKAMVVPILTRVLTGAGKYVVPPILAMTGLQQAEVENWWTATASVLAAAAIGAVCSWIDRRGKADKKPE